MVPEHALQKESVLMAMTILSLKQCQPQKLLNSLNTENIHFPTSLHSTGVYILQGVCINMWKKN